MSLRVIIASISFSVTWKKLILLPALYEKGGKQFALSIIELKKLLKMFAFSQKSETNFGVFYYRTNGLILPSTFLEQY